MTIIVDIDDRRQSDEQQLLQQFYICQIIKLHPDSRAIIANLTKQLELGMDEFVDKDMEQGAKDIMEYNLNYHIVPGLLGDGLSHLFAACGLEQL